MRKLDTLYARCELPKADFIKIDCEGYEPQVLHGAEAYLTASCPLGVDVETTFTSIRRYPTRILARCSSVLIDTISSLLILHSRRPPAFLTSGRELVTRFLLASSQNKLTRIDPQNDRGLRYLCSLREGAHLDRGVWQPYRFALDICRLRSAVAPSKSAALIGELTHFVPHLGLGVLSTVS